MFLAEKSDMCVSQAALSPPARRNQHVCGEIHSHRLKSPEAATFPSLKAQFGEVQALIKEALGELCMFKMRKRTCLIIHYVGVKKKKTGI